MVRQTPLETLCNRLYPRFIITKRTLLELTQSILNDLDGEAVNSIFDTEEAIQYANVVRDTYFNIVAARQLLNMMNYLN